ncbi:MAG: hypothetical protein QGH45_24520, partial [Myxococcota bacterium]|nr:hypothetical protein [Myxococcota bacterium]
MKTALQYPLLSPIRVHLRASAVPVPIFSGLLAAMMVVSGCPTTPADGWTLEALEVGENPANLLSRTLRWTTSTPASSHVEFGDDGVLTHRVGDDAQVTEHEVVVFGLRAETEYSFEAVSVDGNGDEVRGT